MLYRKKRNYRDVTDAKLEINITFWRAASSIKVINPLCDIFWEENCTNNET